MTIRMGIISSTYIPPTVYGFQSVCLSVNNTILPKWKLESPQIFCNLFSVALGVHILSFILGNAL